MKISQLKILFFTFFLIAAMPLFAQVVPQGLTNLGTQIKDVFTGDLVRIILVCCLAGCAVAYGFNKDNEKMKRNIIAIAIAIALVVGASAIVDVIWSAS
jgi:type IV secretory pathway VirB2 component (pilin)